MNFSTTCLRKWDYTQRNSCKQFLKTSILCTFHRRDTHAILSYIARLNRFIRIIMTQWSRKELSPHCIRLYHSIIATVFRLPHLIKHAGDIGPLRFRAVRVCLALQLFVRIRFCLHGGRCSNYNTSINQHDWRRTLSRTSRHIWTVNGSCLIHV